MPPEFIAALVVQPIEYPRTGVLEPLEPDVAPGLADHLRVGRTRVEAEHGRGPFQVLGDQAAAHVMDIVGIAVVGRAHGDDRLEGRRMQGRDLQAVEAAPGNPGHADMTGTPGLGSQPGDHGGAVIELLLEIFTLEQALGIAGAANIDPHAGIALAGHILVHGGVADAGKVAPPVRQMLKDRRHRVGLGVLGQPDARRQPAAVGHFDPGGLDMADLAWVVGDVLHGLLFYELR